jgi:curved DNA-binding protein CbpA
MNFTTDYYGVLGLTSTATPAELKVAYRSLAKKYHPDLHPGDAGCEERIKAINEAWEVLGDPEKRFVYDTYKAGEIKARQAEQKTAANTKERPSEPKTFTKKQWVAKEVKYYVTGELLLKYRGRQDDALSADILREVVYNLQIIEVRARINNQDIHPGPMPEVFRQAFAGEKVALQVPQPIKCTVVTGQLEQYYELAIRDLTVPAVTIRDVTKDDGDSFGTLTGPFYGYVSYTDYRELETVVTEMSGETGRKEEKTEWSAPYERREYYHADGTTYWGNWNSPAANVHAGNNWQFTPRPAISQPAGCSGNLRSAGAYLVWGLFILLLLPRLLIVWPLLIFFLLLWLLSVKRWSWVFGLVSIFGLLCFLGSLLQAFSHRPVAAVIKRDKPRETQADIRPVPHSSDSLITRFRAWSDYDGQAYEGRYSLRQSAVRSAGLYKENLPVAADGDAGYDQVLQQLYLKDSRQLAGLYHLLEQLRDQRRLSKARFAEMFVSMVQDIPYALVLPQACDGSLYPDQYINTYLNKPDARCEANQRFGINTPVEFLAGLNGDCDTRTLLIYTVLSHYGYHVALLSSDYYSHSLIGIDLPYEGAAYPTATGRLVLWETTTPARPGLLPNDISNLDYWRISLNSQP